MTVAIKAVKENSYISMARMTVEVEDGYIDINLSVQS